MMPPEMDALRLELQTAAQSAAETVASEERIVLVVVYHVPTGANALSACGGDITNETVEALLTGALDAVETAKKTQDTDAN